MLEELLQRLPHSLGELQLQLGVEGALLLVRRPARPAPRPSCTPSTLSRRCAALMTALHVAL